MEVLPCSSVRYVGESDCVQQNSGTTLIYNGDSNGFEHVEQVQMADGRVGDLLLNVEGPQMERQSEGQRAADELPMSEGHQSGASYSDFQVESQRFSSDSHDFEEDDVNVQNYCTEPCVASENSHLIVDTIESEPNNCRYGEPSLSEPKWLQHDESVALWVKVTVFVYSFHFHEIVSFC